MFYICENALLMKIRMSDLFSCPRYGKICPATPEVIIIAVAIDIIHQSFVLFIFLLSCSFILNHNEILC